MKKRNTFWYTCVGVFFLIAIPVLIQGLYISSLYLDTYYLKKKNFERLATIIGKPIPVYVFKEGVRHKDDWDLDKDIDFMIFDYQIRWDDGTSEKIGINTKGKLDINTRLRIRGEISRLFGNINVKSFDVLNNQE